MEPGLWSLGCGALVVEPRLWILGCEALVVEPGLWILCTMYPLWRLLAHWSWSLKPMSLSN